MAAANSHQMPQGFSHWKEIVLREAEHTPYYPDKLRLMQEFFRIQEDRTMKHFRCVLGKAKKNITKKRTTEAEKKGVKYEGLPKDKKSNTEGWNGEMSLAEDGLLNAIPDTDFEEIDDFFKDYVKKCSGDDVIKLSDMAQNATSYRNSVRAERPYRTTTVPLGVRIYDGQPLEQANGPQEEKDKEIDVQIMQKRARFVELLGQLNEMDAMDAAEHERVYQHCYKPVFEREQQIENLENELEELRRRNQTLTQTRNYLEM